MTTLQQSAQNQLRQIVEQIERLNEEKNALSGDISEKFKEAKGLGFDVKVLRRVLSLRKLDKADRDEAEALIDTYMHALEGTPLGDYAERHQAESEALAEAAE
jgi:uncharacterized protein (UPF0335 family)